MNSLQRVMAAIRGEPFDQYPFVNPYPFWSMLPNWPALTGLTFLHAGHGTMEQRLRCISALHETIGLDWLPAYGGIVHADDRYHIESDHGDSPDIWTDTPFPLFVLDTTTGERTRHDAFPIDDPRREPQYASAADVEALDAPQSTREILAAEYTEGTRKIVEVFGDEVFLLGGVAAPFAACFYSLGFQALFDAIVNNRSLLHAIAERTVEQGIQQIRSCATLGVHGIRMNEFFCSADLISETDYLELVWPYNKRLIDAMKEAGVVAVLENLGWIEPRLPHVARFEVDVYQTESSLKGYRNDIGEIRKAMGDHVCLCSNSRILQVIEQGDEAVWQADAEDQARGIGEQRRFLICGGSPTTWATTPDRLKRYGAFMQQALAKLAPPPGAH